MNLTKKDVSQRPSRVRVPRGQLRDGRHPARGTRGRQGGRGGRKEGHRPHAHGRSGRGGAEVGGPGGSGGSGGSGRAHADPVGRARMGPALEAERRGCRDGAPALPRARRGGEQALLGRARRAIAASSIGKTDADAVPGRVRGCSRPGGVVRRDGRVGREPRRVPRAVVRGSSRPRVCRVQRLAAVPRRGLGDERRKANASSYSTDAATEH